MNKKQMKVMWVTLSILFVLALFPMRVTTDGNVCKRGFAYTQGLKLDLNGGGSSLVTYSKIDAETTLVQMLPAVIIGVGLVLAFRDKNNG